MKNRIQSLEHIIQLYNHYMQAYIQHTSCSQLSDYSAMRKDLNMKSSKIHHLIEDYEEQYGIRLDVMREPLFGDDDIVAQILDRSGWAERYQSVTADDD